MRWYPVVGTLCALSLFPAVGLAQSSDSTFLPIPTVQTEYPSTSFGDAYRGRGAPTTTASYQDVLTRYRQEPATDQPLPIPEPRGGDAAMGLANPWQTDGYGAYGQLATGGDCGDCGCAPCCCPACWYGSAGGMWMTRDDENTIWLSFDTANVASSLLSSRDAAMGWAGGVDARLGRYLCCGQYALEVAYWGAYPSLQEANAVDPDGAPLTASDLNSTFAFTPLEYNGVGNPVTGFYDNAFRHRLRRSYEIHNVELNLIGSTNGQPLYARGGLTASWSAGFRYLRFSDGFEYAGDTVDAVFTGDVNEIRYSIDLVNDLFGGQIGGRFDYGLTRRLSAYGAAQVGIFGNRMSHRSFIGGAAGPAVVNDPTSPFDGQAFDVSSNKYDASLLGELDFGLNWQLTHHWSLGAGYRAVGVAGIGLSTNQIPFNFADLPGVADIESNGNLILHGGYAFAEFSY